MIRKSRFFFVEKGRKCLWLKEIRFFEKIGFWVTTYCTFDAKNESEDRSQEAGEMLRLRYAQLDADTLGMGFDRLRQNTEFSPRDSLRRIEKSEVFSPVVARGWYPK
ncbi:MAG: hypothetical protein ACYSWP_14030 [Planctomycetota bacterium]|jgi:hypothetical protein